MITQIAAGTLWWGAHFHAKRVTPQTGNLPRPPRACEQTGRYLSPMTPPFRTTLWRVLGIQLVTLVVLWLLQSRYAS